MRIMKINNIKIEKDFSWIWLLNKKVENFDETNKRITGKYLFFSKNKKKLIKLAEVILEKFKLIKAKVPSSSKPIGDEFALCIYDIEPRFKLELRDYADEKEIKYRYWKSDEDTLKGRSSERFLNNLSPEERRLWTT